MTRNNKEASVATGAFKQDNKKRRIDLDIIRITAILMIFVFHFYEAYGFTDSRFYIYKNGGWGAVGTTMFYILSGYLLTLGSMKAFYKRRFLSIFPAFYIAFIMAYLFEAHLRGYFTFAGSLKKLMYTLLGIDGYVGYFGISSYALVGEWFTAIIIAIYIIYPLLRYALNHFKWTATILILLAYLANLKYGIFSFSPDATIFTGLLMFWIGMLFARYQDKLHKVWFIAIPLIMPIILIINVKLPYYPLIWKNLLGISLFLVIELITYKCLSIKPLPGIISKPITYLSGVSYAIYLTHHYIIYKYRYLKGFIDAGPYTLAVTFTAILGLVLVISILITFLTNIITRKKR